MSNLRANPTTEIGGVELSQTRDYLNGQVKHLANGRIEATNLPVSDVLYFAMEDGSWACIRPSGTEPKIKLYFGVYLPPGATMAEADAKLDKLTADMKVLIDVD